MAELWHYHLELERIMPVEQAKPSFERSEYRMPSPEMNSELGTRSSELTSVPTAAAAWTEADLRANPHSAPDKAVRVQRMFAAIARRYDLNNRLHSFGRDQAWRRKAVRLCAVKPTDDVLDCACGTGDLTLVFAEAGPRSVTGLDFTPEMLEIARAKAIRIARAPTGRQSTATRSHSDHDSNESRFMQGDAMNLPFEDRSFDVLSIAWGIRNVADPLRALMEFRRVLRPGGRLCVLEFSEPRNAVLRGLNRLYCGKIMPWTATIISGDRSGAYRYLPKSVADFPSPQAFAMLVEQAGFPPPTLHRLTFGVCTIYLAEVPL